MKSFLSLLLLASTLCGCVVVPADYGYGDGAYYEHEHHWEGHRDGYGHRDGR